MGFEYVDGPGAEMRAMRMWCKMWWFGLDYTFNVVIVGIYGSICAITEGTA